MVPTDFYKSLVFRKRKAGEASGVDSDGGAAYHHKWKDGFYCEYFVSSSGRWWSGSGDTKKEAAYSCLMSLVWSIGTEGLRGQSSPQLLESIRGFINAKRVRLPDGGAWPHIYDKICGA